MSTFYQCCSNIHFPAQCLFFDRAVDFKVSLYYSRKSEVDDKMKVGLPFFVKFFFQTQFAEGFPR